MTALKDQLVQALQQPMTQPLSWVVVVGYILVLTGAAMRAAKGAGWGTVVILVLAGGGELFLMSWGATHALPLPGRTG